MNIIKNNKIIRHIRLHWLKLGALVILIAFGTTIAVHYYGHLKPLINHASSSGLVGPQNSCDFYASPIGTSGGSGAIGSPWDLQTALNKTAQVVTGKILCLRDGTYSGKFTSALTGGTVTSAPGEWAKLEGFQTTTLTSGITAASTSLPVASVSGFNSSQLLEVVIGNEVIRVLGQSGSSLTVYGRGSSGGGAAASHSSGSTVVLAGRGLLVDGSNTTYRDFEISNSDPVRNETFSAARTWGRGDGITVTGSGNKVINLVVHDGISGIVTSGTSSNTEIYGNIIYNTGFVQIDGSGAGHGMYLENSSGYSKIYNNIAFNAYNLGMQAFGQTGPYVGGDFQDNAFANSGSPLGSTLRNRTAVFGTNSQLIPSISILRNHFYHQPNTLSYGPIVGYGAGVSSATFSNNYIVGGQYQFDVENTTNLTGTGNKIYSVGTSSGGYVLMDGTTAPYSWNNNTYYGAGTNDWFARNGTTYTFTAWKAATGLDALSTTTTSAMPNQVIIIPNTYETGRANVIIYSTAGGTTANVDLSQTGLTNGQSYEIRTAQNITGSIVTAGIYDSANPVINISLTGAAASVATPIGNGSTPSSTCPEFCPMVVLPTSPIDSTSPTVSLSAPTSGSTVSGSSTTVSATASDNVGVVGVQFKLDGSALDVEDTSAPYSIVWDTTLASDASHILTAVARDAAGNSTTSTGINVVVDNSITPPGGGGGGGGSGGGGSRGGGSSGGGGGGTTPSKTPTANSQRLVDDAGTYYLIQGGYKNGITSPGILYSCGFEFKDSQIPTAADISLPTNLLLPCDGALVKSAQDQTVYIISGGQRYGFVSASIFLNLGYKFSSVLVVTNPELQRMVRGADLSNSSAAHLPGANVNANGTIYWIDQSSVRHAYPSLQVYNSWNRDDDFSTVVPANNADSQLPVGDFEIARDLF
jgi:hypothetical protein